MSTAKPPHLLALEYEKYAEEYLRSLPPEHFMEATSQATQRKITLESFNLVHARRPDVQTFSELLVQYPRSRQSKPGQVVPDTMVVLCDKPIKAEGSFNVLLLKLKPFWVLEYVSRHNERKDYEESFQKYEHELQVPWYLVFHPEEEELTLYRHSKGKYATVKPNKQGRYAIPKLEMEVGLLGGWVRFWYQGQLLPLPADLLRDLEEARQEMQELRRRAEEEHQARLALQRELETLRARLQQSPPPPGGNA